MLRSTVSIAVACMIALTSMNANAFGESHQQLQEEAALTVAREVGMTRDQVDSVTRNLAENAPLDTSHCPDFGIYFKQQMTHSEPFLSEKAANALYDWANETCLVKNDINMGKG